MKQMPISLPTLAVTSTFLIGHPSWATSALPAPVSVGFSSNGVPIFAKRDTANVSGGLLALHQEFQAYSEQARKRGASAGGFKSLNPGTSIIGDSVLIDTAAFADPDVLANDLRALGAQRVTVFGRMVSARLPLTAIPQLSTLSSLQVARLSYMQKHVGAVTSQGDPAMRSNIARTTFAVDGTGIKVGTISDSYDCLGTAAAGVASGDLPVGVTVLVNGACPQSDEGRGMMEIVHDIAPGATLSFNSADGGQAGFAAGIIALANDGATVINDDISYPNEPFYQDGVISQAINTVKAMGVAYFTASGNGARKGYEAAFRPSGQTVNLGVGPQQAHDFDPGAGVDICQQITIPVGSSVGFSFQWDQPFFSVSGAPGSLSDMDIILTDASCNTAAAPLATAVDSNIGADAIELLNYTNPGPATTFGVVILHSAGPFPGLMKNIDTAETITFDEFDTRSGSSYGHPLAQGGLSVAAAYYADTPAFGTTPPVVEGSSSAGGGAILFSTSGVRLVTPEQRLQPAITAPDGGDTSFFGGDDPDDTGFPNFFGTSAAAPHAAGVAALMRQFKPSLTPDLIYTALKASAIDMDDPSTVGFDTGFDFSTGAGLIQADAALRRVEENIFANGFELTP